MAEDTSQERTEEATPRRRQQAREEGQVARSRELNTMLVLMSSVAAGTFFGPGLAKDLAEIFKSNFAVKRQSLFDEFTMVDHLAASVLDMMAMLTPFFAVVVIAAVGGSVALGGFSFSTKALVFKWEKLDPVKGLKRVFGVRGLVELFKALGKFVLVAVVAIAFLTQHLDEFFTLGAEPVEQGMGHAMTLLLWSFLATTSALILIAFIDVPFQLWEHSRQLKMTRQEVKDDAKDTEGNPEVRGQVRKLQREMAQRRMMEEVPKADVIITNPEHYSVALKYDQKNMNAPILVAKGADRVALRIREVARDNEVIIVAAPPLARAIFHTTELDQEIPAGLYLAVAQVLAYVFQLKQANKAKTGEAREFSDLPIPDDMRFDS